MNDKLLPQWVVVSVTCNFSYICAAPPPPPEPFCDPFSGTTRVSRCQKRTSGLYGAMGRLTEADTLTIRLGATPSGLTSAHLHRPPIFFTGRMPFRSPNQQRQSTEGN